MTEKRMVNILGQPIPTKYEQELLDKISFLERKNKLLTEALEGMKRLNLHLYEEGTVGNMCYKEMIEALNKTKN